MTSPTVADPRRLAAVERSGLVDSPRDPVFDELAAMAAKLLDAPFAFVTAVDGKRSFWKAAHGIADGTRFNTVDDSFCQYVIDRNDELIVGDAANHPLTASNPSIDSMGVMAWAGCPVQLDGQTLGTFCVVDQRTRSWSERDRKILRKLAATVNREVASRDRGEPRDRQLELLRSSLLPATLPRLPGLDIAAWHRPASDSLLLGDFYDALDLGAGRALIVIGDVCGHGRLAAEITTILRDTIRRCASHDSDPARIVEECNTVLLHSSEDQGRFATMCAMVVDRSVDRTTIATTSAGHPPLLVRRADGSVDRLPAPDGLPLGITAAAEYGRHSRTLDVGDTIIGYTDGATDCRNAHGELFGAPALEALVADAPATTTTPTGLLDHLSNSIAAFADELIDDIALITLTVAA